MSGERATLAVSALVFLVVLMAVYTSVRLFHTRRHRQRRARLAPPRSGFLGEFYYTPSAGSCRGGVSSCGRGDESGNSGACALRCCRACNWSGRMPAIETAGGFGCDGGCGRLGVPP